MKYIKTYYMTTKLRKKLAAKNLLTLRNNLHISLRTLKNEQKRHLGNIRHCRVELISHFLQYLQVDFQDSCSNSINPIMIWIKFYCIFYSKIRIGAYFNTAGTDCSIPALILNVRINRTLLLMIGMLLTVMKFSNFLFVPGKS